MKRGQKAQARIKYAWSHGIKGSYAVASYEDAVVKAERQAAQRGPNGETCTVILIDLRKATR